MPHNRRQVFFATVDHSESAFGADGDEPTNLGVQSRMSAILQLIEAANAEAERLRHMARNARRPNLKRLLEREAIQWAYLAAAAKAEFEIMK